MVQTAVLNKILHVREQEKQNAHMEQLKAVDYFEKVAKKLYQLLKTKEQAEQGLEKYMKTEVTITIIKEQSLYIDTLTKKIIALQQQVQQAREEMEIKQLKLTEAYVEVKKVEKMIEKREQVKIELDKKLELIEMDEISIRQYTNHVQN